MTPNICGEIYMERDSTVSTECQNLISEPTPRYQLRLPFNENSKHSSCDRPLDTEETLRRVFKQDLTFKGEKTAYATHNLHAFAAKFPPQLPRLFINELTHPGERILDPMAGSGTTVVEAVLAGRQATGIDLDPLATLISSAKCTPLNPLLCAEAGFSVLQRAKQILDLATDNKLVSHYPLKAIEFFTYWFESHTIIELHALAQAIREVEDARVRTLLQVVFSSIIVTKSGSLTRARDLAHSRPHRDPKKQVTQSAIIAFSERLNIAIKSLEEIVNIRGSAIVIRADSRMLPLQDNSAHLIVTSPPYAANAIDYMRAHKFSLMWLGYTPQSLTNLRSKYIGSELRAPILEFASEAANHVLDELLRKDERRAAVIAHYFRDIEMTLMEMLRVLIKGRAAILVVGSSTIRGTRIQVPTVLAQLADSVGFRVICEAKREIVRNARMMPVSHNSTQSGIEARMHEEGVIGLIKP